MLFVTMIPILAGATAIASYLISWLMRRVSPSLGYMDHPAGRKAHARAMPLGGGFAIVGPMILVIVTGMVLTIYDVYPRFSAIDWLTAYHQGIAQRANQMGGILLAGFILHVLGLFDDVKDLGPAFKLIVQTAAAALVVVGFDVRVALFVPFAPLSVVITIVWIVVITNAFNFLDNADGLSTGVALVCTAVLLASAVAAGQVFVSAYLACLAGVLVGFLVHNFPPARIYLGDAGSMPVGFFLAVGSILTTYYHETAPTGPKTAVLIPLVVLAIPLYDFVSVVYLRYRSGANPFKGDQRHFSHRLIDRGFTTKEAVMTIYLACVGTALAAIVLRYVTWPYAILLLVQTACLVAIIATLERQRSGSTQPCNR